MIHFNSFLQSFLETLRQTQFSETLHSSSAADCAEVLACIDRTMQLMQHARHEVELALVKKCTDVNRTTIRRESKFEVFGAGLFEQKELREYTILPDLEFVSIPDGSGHFWLVRFADSTSGRLHVWSTKDSLPETGRS